MNNILYKVSLEFKNDIDLSLRISIVRKVKAYKEVERKGDEKL